MSVKEQVIVINILESISDDDHTVYNGPSIKMMVQNNTSIAEEDPNLDDKINRTKNVLSHEIEKQSGLSEDQHNLKSREGQNIR